MQVQTQVLIVGAGPAGLTLAVDLGQRGVRCVLVERKEARLFRALARPHLHVPHQADGARRRVLVQHRRPGEPVDPLVQAPAVVVHDGHGLLGVPVRVHGDPVHRVVGEQLLPLLEAPLVQQPGLRHEEPLRLLHAQHRHIPQGSAMA
jgi:choline dehydrogenase-like flavoprotein